MFVFVQAVNFGKLLKIEIDSQDLVRDLKSKIVEDLGGNVSQDELHTLNYLGNTLDCETPVSAYHIKNSSLLYMGDNSVAQQQPQTQPQQLQLQSQQQQYQSYPYQNSPYQINQW